MFYIHPRTLPDVGILDSRLQYQRFRVHNQSDQPTGMYTCSKINPWLQIFAFGHIEFCSNFDLKWGRLELISSYAFRYLLSFFQIKSLFLYFLGQGRLYSSLPRRRS